MTNEPAPKHANIGQYLAFTFVRPRTMFADLVDDPRGRAFAALALVTVAVPYSLVE